MHPIAHTDRWRRRHDRAPGGHHREYANPGRSLQPKAPDCGSRLIPDIVSQCCGKAARLLADVTVCLLLVMKAPEPVPAANPVQGQPLDRFLFKDPAFVFQSLWRFGLIASGGADLGEALTAVSHIRDGNREDWYAAWSAMGPTG